MNRGRASRISTRTQAQAEGTTKTLLSAASRDRFSAVRGNNCSIVAAGTICSHDDCRLCLVGERLSTAQHSCPRIYVARSPPLSCKLGADRELCQCWPCWYDMWFMFRPRDTSPLSIEVDVSSPAVCELDHDMIVPRDIMIPLEYIRLRSECQVRVLHGNGGKLQPRAPAWSL